MNRVRKSPSEVKRSRVEAQGFLALDDGTIEEIHLWLRLAPAVSLAWAAAGTFLGSALVLWCLVPITALGAITRGHPFDLLYNRGIRHLLDSPRLPPYNAPRRFGAAIASVWLAGTSIAFHFGATQAGVALGGVFMVAPLLNVTTGIYLAALAYRMLFGPPRATAELLAYADGRTRHAPRRRWWPRADRTQPRVINTKERPWTDTAARPSPKSRLRGGREARVSA